MTGKKPDLTILVHEMPHGKKEIPLPSALEMDIGLYVAELEVIKAEKNKGQTKKSPNKNSPKR